MTASPTLYCQLADVLALVSMDAQARLATDPQVAVPLSVKGDGTATLFDTPFRGATKITTVVGGVETANTLVPGGATNGNDQVTFATHPANNALITAQADLKAVNTDVILQCMVLASGKIMGAMARYGTESPPADTAAILLPIAVFFTRWFLRMRRNMSEYDPILREYDSNDRWLLRVATGQIALPADDVPVIAAPPVMPVVRAESSVFEAPYSSSFQRDFLT
jgi:phage gp36-like protein